MSTSDSCKGASSKSNYNDDVCGVNDMLHNMSMDDNVVSVCANCGKEGDDLKSCTACKLVKYCNRDCQIAHRPQHKKECRRRAAELHDEKLFNQPPMLEDCPICFIRLPILLTGKRYMACCGMEICSGCFHAPVYDNQGNKVDYRKCPFCRTPEVTSLAEASERDKTRADADDPMAIYNTGMYYRDGTNGFPQDHTKALELYHRAGELGYARAYNSIGNAYFKGRGVEVDKKKAVYYWELGAIGGCVGARFNIGILEETAGNWKRAVKHFMIAIGGGDDDSLQQIKSLYSKGHTSKEVYTKALQLYQAYLDEVKSRQRDRAAAFSEEYRCY